MLRFRACPFDRSRRLAVALAVLFGLLGSSVSAVGADAGDLDGDDRDELVVGVPDEKLGSALGAGLIHILRGSPSGTTARRSAKASQRTLGGTSELNDRFGGAVAYGDFDRDGFDDVVVGAPAEDLLGANDTGVVHVLFGADNRALRQRHQLITPFDVAGRPGSGDFFGAALAVGRLNGDDYDDLVIGVPGKDLPRGSLVAAGAVVVVYGGRNGLRTGTSVAFSQQGAIAGAPESFDAFGVALAVGDVDGDGFDDVAIGAPGEGLGSASSAGVVHVLFGASRGVRVARNVMVDQRAGGGQLESGDAFGRTIDIGDFDRDGIADLVVAAPGEDSDGGAVSVFAGSRSGLAAPGRTLLQGSGGVPGVPTPGAQWGRSLAVGDYNGDGDDDLAVGAPFADPGGVADAGEVTVLGGEPGSGISGNGGFAIDQQAIAQSSLGSGDQFGWALRSGDFNGDGVADLAVSARGENVRRSDAGIVQVISGVAGSSLAVALSMTFSQVTEGISEQAESGDRFGTGL